MKTVGPLFLFLLFLPFENGNAWGPAQDPGEAGVRDAENGWSRAFVTGDVGYLDALLDPEYISVGAHGDARPKATILALASQYATQHPGSKSTLLPSTSKIQIKGSTALVVHHGDSDISADIFFYSEGRWHAWYSQHTNITK